MTKDTFHVIDPKPGGTYPEYEPFTTTKPETYKCFGCDNEFDRPPKGIFTRTDWERTFINEELCHRCVDKLLMRKGSL